MKLITFIRNGNGSEEIGILKGEDSVLPLSETRFSYRDMNDLIVRASRDDLKEMGAASGRLIPVGDVRILAPIPRPLQDILCLGMNYSDHAQEVERYSRDAFNSDRKAAVYFSKRASYCPGPGDEIPPHAGLTEKLDFENELAVVIGRDASDVQPEQVPSVIFGYTIVNDVSARDLQIARNQWYFGKSLEGFAPMGPCIVTSDEIAFPPRLSIKTTLNGETMQDADTSMLIHSITEIICELSGGMTLKAGTVIATGTPKGVLMGMDEPEFMKSGDVVSCFIEGIGTLTNRVG